MIALVIALACGCGARHRGRGAGGAGASDTPAGVVEAATGALERWRQAYELRSVDELAKLYARDGATIVVHEGQAHTGWPAVEAMLKARLAKATAVHVRISDISVAAVGTDGARAVAGMRREIGDGTVTLTETGTLTLVLRREGDGWVIVLEHFSYKRS
ncbi:MAG: nuclear transport factor 2 family protein [Deltaproteobacteria bacterium]|nr:nuclear transport factor 2 family protein [Deltaproteobacteria bacterium]MCW5806185.1 nuclear transport factor 2 family protein [Deltaproteobacteria bacterium]